MKKSINKCRVVSHKSLIVFLLSTLNVVYAADEQTMREAILGQGDFTQNELSEMDQNQDGVVDVSDLLTQINPLLKKASFAVKTSEMDETTGLHSIVLNLTGSISGTLKYALGGSATLGEDYTDLTNGSAVINNSTAMIQVSAQVDTMYEGNESILLTLLPGENYQLGSQRTHTITLNENPAETQANYLFVIENKMPGSISSNQLGLASALLSKTVSVAITFSHNGVMTAHLNEDKSIGIADNNANSNMIPVLSINYDDSKNLEMIFEYPSESESFVSGASMSELQFDPDTDSFPSFEDEPKKQLMNRLTLVVNGFDITTEKLTDKLLQGSFSLDITGVLNEGTVSASSGSLVGTLQQ